MRRPIHQFIPGVIAGLLIAVLSIGTADAAGGGGLAIGHVTKETKTSTLANTGKGPALALKTKKSSTAPLSVSNSTQVPKLNTSLVGGRSAASLGPVIFSKSGTLTIPAGVTHVIILAVAGGGGGGLPDNLNTHAGNGGGQGGNGTFVVPVKAGQHYSVVLGKGGTPATSATTEGTAGGDTYIAPAGKSESQALVMAAGGSAPTLVTSLDCGGTDNSRGGAGGDAEVPAGSPAIDVVQTFGQDGGQGACVGGQGGTGGGGTGGNVAGQGGSGGPSSGSGAVTGGQAGYVMVEFST
jgi:hypothetical protein